MMKDPSLCLGKRAGTDYASNCRTCSRHETEPKAGVRYLVPHWRSQYVHGQTVHTCLDRRPLQHEASVAPVTPQVCGADASAVSLRNRAAKWLLAAGAVTIAVAAAVYSTGAHAAQCGPWNPATDPYQGDQAAAVMRLDEIPEAERRTLADMVAQQYGWQRVMVARDGIVGAELGDLRSMNFGTGRICAGAVDRSTWPAGRHEAARAYTVGRWSVLVFDSCRNVALATNTAALPPSSPYTPQEVRAGYRGGLGSLFGVPSMSVAEPSSMALAIPALLAALAGWRARA